MTELLRALAAFAEVPTPAHRRLAEVLDIGAVPTAQQHTELFRFQLYPYASVYVGVDGMLGGDAADRVAGFWRALGYVPPREPDHLSALLSLAATLGEAEAAETDAATRVLLRESRAALLHEHLAPWLVPYLDKVEAQGAPPYRAWATLLRIVLLHMLEGAGLPERLPAHLRSVPALPDPRDAPDAFVRGIFAPARTGMILTRRDLARAAKDLGLGLRLGERAFVARALLAQSPDGTLHWLRDEARAWEDRHRFWAEELGIIADFWIRRSRAAARLFAELAAERSAAALAREL